MNRISCFFALALLLLPLACTKDVMEEPDNRTLEYSLEVTNKNYVATTVLDGIGNTRIAEVLNQPAWVSEVSREDELLDGSMVLCVNVKSDPALDGTRTARLQIKMSNGATAFVTITQRAGLPAGFNADETPSVNTKFEEDWSSVTKINLVSSVTIENGRKKVISQDLPLPWAFDEPGNQYNMPKDDLVAMLKNKDHWKMVFNTTGIEDSSCENRNYFGLYNTQTGILRIFYYWPKELIPASGANDHMWFVRGRGTQAQHNSSIFAVPLQHEFNAGTDNYKEFEKRAGVYYTSAIAKDIGDNMVIVPKVGWWCFDMDISAMRNQSFFDNYEEITIGMDLFDTENVILNSVFDGSITGSLKGNVNLDGLVPTSANAAGKIIPSVLSGAGGFATNKFFLDYLTGGIGANVVPSKGLWALGIGCLLSIGGNIGKEYAKGSHSEDTMKSLGELSVTADLALNATIETKGLIKSQRSHSVPEVSIPLSYIKNIEKTKAAPGDGQVGRGLWNISNDPVVYIVKDAFWANKAQATYYSRKDLNWYRAGNKVAEYDISMSPYQLGLRLISFFDPTSIGEVVINEELFGHPTDFRVGVSYGIYPGSKAGYTDWFRNACSLNYNPITLSTSAKDQKVSTGSVPGAVKAPFRVFKMPYNKDFFQIIDNTTYPEDVATRLSEQDVNDGGYQRRYYGSSLFYCTPEASSATVDEVQYVADPQIFVPYNESRRVITDPDIPDMVVSVEVVFQSQGPGETEPTWKTYTLRYLPKVEFIGVNEVKGIADRIGATANGGQRSDITYITYEYHNAIVQKYSSEISSQLAN